MNLVFDENLIKNRLLDFTSPKRMVLDEQNFIHSATTLLIVPHPKKPYDLILIRRTKRENDKHSGEMSFPGGKFDKIKDKNLLDTALRETEEELGILKKNINILGCLDDHLTPKGFIITPVVGYINENQLIIKQEEEVKEVVKIPVDFFTNKKNYHERTYYIKNDLIGVGKFKYMINNNIYVIFGATSHMIQNYIDRVYNIGLLTPGCRRINCEDIKDKIEKELNSN